MSGEVALQGYVDKWLQWQPEARAAEVFVAPPVRPLWRAWGALATEIAEATFELADAGVARTKLAWWGQDLAAAASARHPVAKALFAHAPALAVPERRWRELAFEAARLSASAHDPADVAAAVGELRPLAEALAAIEAELLGDSNAVHWAVHLQATRSLRALAGLRAERARLPPGAREDLRGYARALLPHLAMPARGSLAALRRLGDLHRLSRLAASGDPLKAVAASPFRHLWLAWRAARSAR